MDEVIIVKYDPRPTLFEAEAARIQKALGNDQVVTIEHIGSTAVPGLAAKPIIDLMVGVYSLQKVQRAIPLLEGLGYVYWRKIPPGRMFFVQGMPPYGLQRTDHLHIVEAYKEFWEERLLFRNYLQAHPYEAQRYQALKLDLARRFCTDREAYTDGKIDTPTESTPMGFLAHPVHLIRIPCEILTRDGSVLKLFTPLQKPVSACPAVL